jgi:hypothetical protein
VKDDIINFRTVFMSGLYRSGRGRDWRGLAWIHIDCPKRKGARESVYIFSVFRPTSESLVGALYSWAENQTKGKGHIH